jgi:PAS domain S-box-containing protein
MIDQATLPTRLSGAYLERLYEGAGLAIFACDIKGGIRGWNALGERLAAARAAGLEQPNLEIILPQEDRALFRERLHELLDTSEPTELRTHWLDPEGRSVDYAIWLAPIRGRDGALEHVSVWFHDITARVQLRRSMRKRERLTTLGAFSGAIAHHYNNLLCSITTSLEYAMNMNTMSAMRRTLRRAADAASRAAGLTQQLLAFAQADHRSSDLSDLTETVLLFFDEREERLKSRGVRLQMDIQPTPTTAVKREALVSVLENLTTNALEAMPDGGVLTITLRPQGPESVLLAVSDSGAGIPAELMERLFEPFFTTKGELAAGATRQAGMGLAVAHGLVSEMHGQITATSNPGGGARFEVLLPTQPTPE